VLKGHCYPQTIIDQCKSIRSNATQLEAYLRDSAAPVAKFVKGAHPTLDTKLVEGKVTSILIDFLNEFEMRPMRKIGWSQALAAYTQRMLTP
jgi:hypothetical protein